VWPAGWPHPVGFHIHPGWWLREAKGGFCEGRRQTTGGCGECGGRCMVRVQWTDREEWRTDPVAGMAELIVVRGAAGGDCGKGSPYACEKRLAGAQSGA